MQNNNGKLNNFLNEVLVPHLSNTQQNKCENEISEKELLDALKNIDSNKTPSNDGLIEKFYKALWQDLKKPFLNAIN